MDNEMFQQAQQFQQRALDTLTRNTYATSQVRAHLRNSSVDNPSEGFRRGSELLSSEQSENNQNQPRIVQQRSTTQAPAPGHPKPANSSNDEEFTPNAASQPPNLAPTSHFCSFENNHPTFSSNQPPSNHMNSIETYDSVALKYFQEAICTPQTNQRSQNVQI